MIKKEVYVICEFFGEDFVDTFMVVESEREAKTICEKKNKRENDCFYDYEKAFCIKKSSKV